MEIITRKEAKEKGLPRYFTGKPCKRGHIAERYTARGCVKCAHEDHSTDYAREWRRNHEKKIRHQRKAWRENNKSHIQARNKAYYERNREFYKEYRKEYYKNNKDFYKEYAKRHGARYAQKRRADKLDRSLPGFEKDILEIYEDAFKMRCSGHDVHVDHVIPLNGRIVSGLHVPWNLQIIPAEENLSKYNKFEAEIEIFEGVFGEND